MKSTTKVKTPMKMTLMKKWLSLFVFTLFCFSTANAGKFDLLTGAFSLSAENATTRIQHRLPTLYGIASEKSKKNNRKSLRFRSWKSAIEKWFWNPCCRQALFSFRNAAYGTLRFLYWLSRNVQQKVEHSFTSRLVAEYSVRFQTTLHCIQKRR